MRRRTLIIVLIVVAILAAGAYAMHDREGGRFTKWFEALHGR
jgi:hypothetical protein